MLYNWFRSFHSWLTIQASSWHIPALLGSAQKSLPSLKSLLLPLITNAVLLVVLCSESGRELLLVASETWQRGMQLLVAASLLAACHLYTLRRSLTPRLRGTTAVLPFLTITVACLVNRGEIHRTIPLALLATGLLVSAAPMIAKKIRFPSHLFPQIRLPSRPTALVLAFISLALITGIAFPIVLGTMLGPVGTLALFVGIYTIVIIELRAVLGAKAVVAGLALLITLNAFFFRDHLVRQTVRYGEPMPNPYSRQCNERPLNISMAIDCWYMVNRNAQGQATMILVASAGGGIRAAEWTAAILHRLDSALPNFSNELFAVSSVSGGSLGALLFKAGLTERESGKSCKGDLTLEECSRKILERDYLGPIFATWLSRDLLAGLAPPIGVFKLSS